MWQVNWWKMGILGLNKDKFSIEIHGFSQKRTRLRLTINFKTHCVSLVQFPDPIMGDIISITLFAFVAITDIHYSTVESDLLNSLAWDIFYILSSTVGYKISTMGYKISTMGYKLYPTVQLSTMGYKLLYPIVDKKYPTLSYQ